MSDDTGDFLLRIILALGVISLGAGLTLLGNIPGATPHVQRLSVVDKLTNGEYDFTPYALYVSLVPPLSYDETIHLVGGWGCHFKKGMPYSILGPISCF